MLNITKDVLEVLADAIVHVNDRGEMISANAAALEVFGVDGPIRDPLVKIIAQIKAGEKTLPSRVSLSELTVQPAPQRDVLWILGGSSEASSIGMQEPPDAGYWLIAPRNADPSIQSRAERTFVSLIGEETRRDLNQMRNLLIDFDRNAAARTEAVRMAGHLVELLGDVSDLSELQQLTNLADDERVFLGLLIQGVLPALPKKNKDAPIRYVLEGLDREPAPVYGKSRWLQQALISLLSLLGEGCPPNGKVKITLQQIGDFVIVTGKAGAEMGGLRSSGAVLKGGGPTIAQLSRRRQLQVARRILELHGGQLRIRSMQGGESSQADAAIESFTLSLPTGTSADERAQRNCNECPVAHQSQQYAKDIAALMDELQRHAH